MYAFELAGEDDAFAAYEAQSATDDDVDVTIIAPGLAVAETITDRIRRLAYTHRVNEVVGTASGAIDVAQELLESSSIDRSGTAAVRARAIRETRVDTRQVEVRLGSVLVDRGFSIDLDHPAHELRVLFSDDVCLLGWLVAESVRDYGARRPTKRPFFQPGGMSPLLARAIVNIAGARSGRIFVDPMCGTGGLLVEAGLVDARVVGIDAQRKMVRGARLNLVADLEPESFDIILGDATSLPLRQASIDCIAFDVPYGRQSKVAYDDLDTLIADSLVEARRLTDHAVVVSDRSLLTVVRDANWVVDATFDRRVHRSLIRHIHVLR